MEAQLQQLEATIRAQTTATTPERRGGAGGGTPAAPSPFSAGLRSSSAADIQVRPHAHKNSPSAGRYRAVTWSEAPAPADAL
eukprot:COSAG04_NODE_2669_length_3757_cov_4.647348_1_plen_82_part_00